MTRRAIVLFALGGISMSLACDLVLQISPLPPATDDGGVADGATEASTEKCDPYAAFGPLTVVGGLPGGEGVVHVDIAPDELTAYVGQLQAGGQLSTTTLNQYTRSSAADSFTGPTKLTQGINSLRTTLDNLTGFWTGIVGPDASAFDSQRIFMAHRSSTAASFPFGTAQILSHMDGGYEVLPVIPGDGQEVFFDESDNGEYETRADSGFTTATPVANINGLMLALSPDGLVTYQSNAGAVQVLTRPDVDSPFSNVGKVSLPDAGNSRFFYWPVQVSADYCTLYLFEQTSLVEPDGGEDVSGTLFVTHKTP